MNQAEARAAFEAEILQLRDPAVSRRCAQLLQAITRGGGVVTARDMKRLYGHLDPEQQVVAFVVDTREMAS